MSIHCWDVQISFKTKLLKIEPIYRQVRDYLKWDFLKLFREEKKY